MALGIARTVLLALLIFALHGPARAQVSTGDAPTFLGLKFPQQIGGASIGSTKDYEKIRPGLGYSVNYKLPGWAVDIYIYNLGQPAIPDDPDSKVVREQFEQAKADILSLGQSGEYANLVVKDEYVLGDSSGKTRLLCAAFAFFQNEVKLDVDSFLCLTSWKHQFIKFRMTTPQHLGSDIVVKNFLDAWSRLLWPS
jgi:hypothetical protein